MDMTSLYPNAMGSVCCNKKFQLHAQRLKFYIKETTVKHQVTRLHVASVITYNNWPFGIVESD